MSAHPAQPRRTRSSSARSRGPGLHALVLGGACVISGSAVLKPAIRVPMALHADCATAAVVGLRWSGSAAGSKTGEFQIVRDGRPIATTRQPFYVDTSVAPSARYSYVVSVVDAAGSSLASSPLNVATAAASLHGDAPYCRSSLISSMTVDWADGYRAAPGSDLWPSTWGLDRHIYLFFGDGGGFGGDNSRGRTSFGIAEISGDPPPTAASETNLYGGYQARHPSLISGKASSIIALGTDFYAIAGIWRSADSHPPADDHGQISSSPEHLEIAYSKGNAYSWHDGTWTFCRADSTAPSTPTDAFCPSGFINFGPGNVGAPDRYVYVFGTRPPASSQGGASPALQTFLARVGENHLLSQSAYQYFAGLDSHAKPLWTQDSARMQAVFIDRNAPQPGCGGVCVMSSTLQRAVYNAGLQRFIGVAQGEYLAQTSFYESPYPWGPWTTISYSNIDAATGSGGWGNLGIAAGASIGVNAINAWTSGDGRTMWMAYSSDGKAPAGALFPPPGSGLDSFNLLRARLTPVTSPAPDGPQ